MYYSQRDMIEKMSDVSQECKEAPASNEGIRIDNSGPRQKIFITIDETRSQAFFYCERYKNGQCGWTEKSCKTEQDFLKDDFEVMVGNIEPVLMT